MSRKLSKRELEVLKLIASDTPNKTIADQLGLSIRTVEKHRQRIMIATNAHSATRLAHLALARGWVVNLYAGET